MSAEFLLRAYSLRDLLKMFDVRMELTSETLLGGPPRDDYDDDDYLVELTGDGVPALNVEGWRVRDNLYLSSIVDIIHARYDL